MTLIFILWSLYIFFSKKIIFLSTIEYSKDLINKYSIENFDLLLIDTEGYDTKIVKDFLLKVKIRPIIIFEYIHSKHQMFSETIQLLINSDYVLFKIEENIICVPKNKKEKIKLN